MIRMPIQERSNWKEIAREFGFKFHTMYGQKYWDESAYYRFNLKQIEEDIEKPTEEIHQMCLAVVDKVVGDEILLEKFCIPEAHWDFIRRSWIDREPSLYSRLDFAYHGQGPVKLYENNADTPTSLYETGFWQWLWLEDNVDLGCLPRSADQYNLVQEKLIARFKELALYHPGQDLYFASCKGSEEDRGTVQYLQDCAAAAGINNHFIYIEDIGCDESGYFTDLEDVEIKWIFKLYPWEFMFREDYGEHLGKHEVSWLEPPWKAILSNKALLPMLWRLFPNHPNLLPAYFEEEFQSHSVNGQWIKKPVFSREGSNISIIDNQQENIISNGPYGEEGYIYQAHHRLPQFGDYYTLIGSWLIDNEPVGISLREDDSPITQDMSRFVPHIIS